MFWLEDGGGEASQVGGELGSLARESCKKDGCHESDDWFDLVARGEVLIVFLDRAARRGVGQFAPG